MGRGTCREMGVIISIAMLVLVLVLGRSDADVNKDKEECANQLVGLATCLPYVAGQAKAPTLDCCDGLKQVLKDSRKCLCILVKDRNDPSVGLKFNATLALSLPQACHAQKNITVSHCLQLLHLAPNSPDAKAFADFAKAAAPSNPTPANTGSSSHSTSDGGDKRKSWVEASSSTIILMFHGSLMIFLINL